MCSFWLQKHLVSGLESGLYTKWTISCKCRPWKTIKAGCSHTVEIASSIGHAWTSFTSCSIRYASHGLSVKSSPRLCSHSNCSFVCTSGCIVCMYGHLPLLKIAFDCSLVKHVPVNVITMLSRLQSKCWQFWWNVWLELKKLSFMQSALSVSDSSKSSCNICEATCASLETKTERSSRKH